MRPTMEAGFACEHSTAVVQSSCLARSGDCARIVSRGDGRVLSFIGDVAGHDARAAGFATELDARVSYLESWASPGQLLRELNAAVEASWPSDVFVSAICFLLDPATGCGSIAAAGQAAPFIRSASCCREVEMHTGPALGLIAEQRYAERRFVLETGDVLVAVTDGVTDPLATASDVLGLGALARILDAGPSAPAAVCASLMSATRGRGFRDDATVLAIAPALTGLAPSALGARAAASLVA